MELNKDQYYDAFFAGKATFENLYTSIMPVDEFGNPNTSTDADEIAKMQATLASAKKDHFSKMDDLNKKAYDSNEKLKEDTDRFYKRFGKH